MSAASENLVMIEPVVRWQREIMVGEASIVEVSLRSTGDPELPYLLTLDGAPYVQVKAVDEPVITPNSSQPVQFVVTPRGPAGERALRLITCSRLVRSCESMTCR